MLSPGSRLGPYEVVSLLGAGGMGEVYRARDTRLGREVAVKVLREEVAADADRLKRFEREARATAALSHPNVVTVFDVGSDEGRAYVVTELLEGTNLRARLRRGALPVPEALALATQVARGLAAAHARGIVHRDLKPENLFLTSSRDLKILDFGLARLLAGDSVHSQDATESKVTGLGALLGTVSYMSPEQAKGESVDGRSDIFSLGVVLHEMLGGRHPFQRTTSAETISAILRDEPPDVGAPGQRVPARIESVAKRCLEKSPEDRFQTASELAIALDRLARGEDDVATGHSGGSGSTGRPASAAAHWFFRPWPGLVLTLSGVVLAGVLIVWVWSPVPAPAIEGYTQLTSDGRMKAGPIVSDGSRLYLCEHDRYRTSIHQVSMAGGETVPISTPLEGPVLADISPKGTELLVFAGPPAGEKQPWIVPLPGGSPRRLADVRAFDGAWSPDGRQIAYLDGSDVYLVKSDGTGSHKLATATGKPSSPRWSPDGDRLRFTVYAEKSTAIWEVRADGTNLHQLFAGWNTPPSEALGSWTPDGKYFVFLSDRNGAKAEIWMVRELRRLFEARSPEPVQLTSGPMQFWMPTPSRDGKKLFAVASQGRGEVVRYDIASRQFVLYQSGLSAEALAFSRDGQWMSYVTYPERALWRSKVDGSERMQLTYPPMQPVVSEWSPDGKQIAFMAARVPLELPQIYVVSADGGTPQRVAPSDRSQSDPTWSPDGRSLVFSQGAIFSPKDPAYPPAIHQVDLETHEVSQIPGSKGMWHPQWSPDGRYLAAQEAPDQRALLLLDWRTRRWGEWVRGERFSVAYSTWSRDSQYVYYESSLVKEPGLFRVRVRDRKVEKLGSLKDIGQGGNVTLWMGLAPDDSPLVMRNLETQEVYALDFRAR